ncbi:unknown [Clostridium sp. CAG:389]|nr:unknown [Clostridium sp. CAG:389]
MVYIEKNDKPNFIEKILNLIRVKENTIILPINEKMTEKKIEKLAMKTYKKITKISNSKKIVLSKEMKEEEKYINYLNTYGMEISEGRWLFEILLTDIVKYITEKQKIEKANISILINDLTDIEFNNIKILAQKYNMINIVTNHIEKFRKLENQLKEEGIIITITNNKKKSLMKSNIIVNVDFPKELLNKYSLNENACIINLKKIVKITQKRFNGLTVNDYEIVFRNDVCDEKFFNGKYEIKDLYEVGMYKKSPFIELREKIKKDGVEINKLFLNNGEL